MDWRVILTGAGILIAAIIGVVKVAFWAGSVNEHKSSVYKFMDEIRGDIRLILDRVPNPTTAAGSPRKLTEFGEKIASDFAAREWAMITSRPLMDRLSELEPYEVEELSSVAIAEILDSRSSDLRSRVRACSYENGIPSQEVVNVLEVILRDELLEIMNRPPTTSDDDPNDLIL